MYYLFLRKKEALDAYKAEFERVKKSIDEGKTPVFCELRSAKTNFFESIPFNVFSGVLMIAGAVLLNKIHANETLNIALVLIINSFCYQIANYLFVLGKHRLRVRLCERLNIDASEQNIAAMESLEYQSV